jgi:hypothetical protein
LALRQAIELARDERAMRPRCCSLAQTLEDGDQLGAREREGRIDA